MTVVIKEVTSKRDLKTFIKFPLKLYKNDPYYVPNLFSDDMNTLSKDRNPAFADAQARYWLAYRDGELVGRIAGMYIPKHEVKWGEKCVRFGWIDFVDDAEVIRALMGAVEGWAKELGMKEVIGPLGFTDLDREGMLIEGFDQLSTMAENYNYPYYPKHLEALGYGKDTDWVEYEISMHTEYEEKIKHAAELIAKHYHLHYFPGKKKDLQRIAPEIFEVLEEAYRHLFGTVPLSKEQVNHYIDAYFGMANMDYLAIIQDENDRIVGFGITFPSMSRALQKNKGQLFPFGFISVLHALRKNDTADLYLVGVRDEYLGKGVNSMMIAKIMDTFRKNGIKKVETNLNLETNNNVQMMWKYFDNTLNKRRRCFIKHLE